MAARRYASGGQAVELLADLEPAGLGLPQLFGEMDAASAKTRQAERGRARVAAPLFARSKIRGRQGRPNENMCGKDASEIVE